MEYVTSFDMSVDGLTPDELINKYRTTFPQFGNELDTLGVAMWLILSGHYADAVALIDDLEKRDISPYPPPVDKAAAQSRFIEALARARPMFEQAAREIEGDASPESKVLADYLNAIEMLRTSPDW